VTLHKIGEPFSIANILLEKGKELPMLCIRRFPKVVDILSLTG
jgi:hypothetical protein